MDKQRDEITLKAKAKIKRARREEKCKIILHPKLTDQHLYCLFPKNKTHENTHHKLDVVKSIGQQVVLILDQANGVEPLAHRLQRAAGTYEGVEGQTLQ